MMAMTKTHYTIVGWWVRGWAMALLHDWTEDGPAKAEDY